MCRYTSFSSIYGNTYTEPFHIDFPQTFSRLILFFLLLLFFNIFILCKSVIVRRFVPVEHGEVTGNAFSLSIE